MSLIKGLELIKTGYIEWDWDKVRDGYELVSGEKLENTTEKTISPKPKKSSSQKKTSKPKGKIVSYEINQPSKNRPEINFEEGKIDTSIGSGTVKFRGNTFNPDDYDYVDEAPWLKDKIKKKIPRNRKGFKLVEIECFKCKKPYKLHPDLVSNIEDIPNVCEKCSKGKRM